LPQYRTSGSFGSPASIRVSGRPRLGIPLYAPFAHGVGHPGARYVDAPPTRGARPQL